MENLDNRCKYNVKHSPSSFEQVVKPTTLFTTSWIVSKLSGKHSRQMTT